MMKHWNAFRPEPMNKVQVKNSFWLETYGKLISITRSRTFELKQKSNLLHSSFKIVIKFSLTILVLMDRKDSYFLTKINRL